MRVTLFLMMIGLMVTVACGNETGQEDNNRTNLNEIQPINYETPQEQRKRLGQDDKSIGELGGYPQSDQEEVNTGDENITAKNEDRYTNERTLQISKYLSERKEIIQSQVAETDDRIYIGVMTGNTYYPDLPKIVEQEVKQIVPDKEIIVFTDKAWWDHMRNKESSPGKDVENQFNDFFNQD